jgi:S-adenosylmethionine hydrolase
LENTLLAAELEKPYSFRRWMESAASVISSVRNGEAAGYAQYKTQNVPRILQPKAGFDGVDCNILYVDHYENVVLDITKEQFEAAVSNRPFRIKVMRMDDITVISDHYGDVEKGEPLARFNDAGYLELAINRDRAATLLGLAHNSGNLRYQTIKIWFQ